MSRRAFRLCLMMLSLAWAAPALSDTLFSAMSKAYSSSEVLKAKRAALRIQDEAVARQVAGVRPQISAQETLNRTVTDGGFGDSVIDTASISLTGSQLIFQGGLQKAKIASAEAGVYALRADLVDTEQTVLLDAVTAFMNMRRDIEFLRLEENNLRLIQQEVRAARDRFEVGEITRTDVSQAEARLAGARSSLALRQGNVEVSRAAYFVAIGQYPGTLQAPPALPQIPQTLEAAQAMARKNHPAIRKAQHEVAQAQFDLKAAQAALGPKFSANGRIGFDKDLKSSPGLNVTETYSVTLQGDIPIYQGGALLSDRRRAQAQLEARQAGLQTAALQVNNAVARAWANLLVSRATIAAQQQQIRAARVAYRGVREEATLGARTTLDVLDAEQDLLAAQTGLIDAGRNETVAVYSLLSAMGLLTAKRLALKVKTYDPAVNYKKVKRAPGLKLNLKAFEKAKRRAGKN